MITFGVGLAMALAGGLTLGGLIGWYAHEILSPETDELEDYDE